MQQGPGNADPLPLAAGEGIGTFVDMLGQTDPIEGGKGLGHGIRRKAPTKRAPEAHVPELPGEDVFHHGEPFHQGVFLKDHAHSSSGPAQFGSSQPGQLKLFEADRSAAGLYQPVDAADQG